MPYDFEDATKFSNSNTMAGKNFMELGALGTEDESEYQFGRDGDYFDQVGEKTDNAEDYPVAYSLGNVHDTSRPSFQLGDSLLEIQTDTTLPKPLDPEDVQAVLRP